MADLATVADQNIAPLLAQHEAVIERGLKSFIEVGEALAAIRDERLYGVTHRNFDAYLADRWPSLGHRNYVGKMIRAARVAEELGAVVPNARPSTEGQVRPLLALKTADERLAAWERAGEHARAAGRAAPTGRDVEVATDAVKRERAVQRAEVERAERAAVAPPQVRVCVAQDTLWVRPDWWLRHQIEDVHRLGPAMARQADLRRNPLAPAEEHALWATWPLAARASEVPAELSRDCTEVVQARDALFAAMEDAFAVAAATIADAVLVAVEAHALAPSDPLVPGATEDERAAALIENRRRKNEGGYCGWPGCRKDVGAPGYCADHGDGVA